MLRQEQDENASLPAAQARVTPEELATSLSRIEARKDNGQRHVDGTISIGEAVQQLGVDTTPEEVLAEVQAIRQEPMKTKERRRPNRQRLALLSGMGLGLIGLVGWWSVPHVTKGQAPPATAIILPAPQPKAKPISFDPNMIVADASEKLITLSEVGDNQPVRCYYERGSLQPYSLPGGGPSWTLIKHSGQVYIRGWVGRLSAQAVGKTGEDVSLWEYSGFDVPMTLPIDDLQVTAQEGDETQFHTASIHLDKYAHEKWQP